jgi:formylglycine-generating enzyme required for sulfatase activity
MRRKLGWWLLLSTVLAAPPAFAGPWVQLPDAIAELQGNPGDRAATAVLDSTGASIVAEAAAGRLLAVSSLLEVYSSLVMRLPNGDRRVQALGREVAAALVGYGRGRRAQDLQAAAAAWTLAATYDPSGPALGLLREILVPPATVTEGAVWRSPLDGAELVHLAATRVRVGCSELDRRCRRNEVFFRWVETPAVWVEKLEVTNARYQGCVRAGACREPRDPDRYRQPQRAAEPVVGVTWQQARDYAAWVGRELPSESQWERAARAGGSSGRFPWGNLRRQELANVWDETTARLGGLAPAGSFPATGPGLQDLAGSVWEWCGDRYQPGLKQLPPDGGPNLEGIGRTVRGGSWRRSIDLARVSVRSWFDESYSADDVGFRCVMPAAEERSDAEVLAIAVRSFAAAPDPGRELEGAALSAEDRRYLERRAVTWLMLENRVGDAVLQAASLLRREQRDTVALDLLDRVEGELLAAARLGDIGSVDAILSGLEQAAAVNSRYLRRRLEIAPRVADTLFACGQRAADEGDRARAAACFEAGLELEPANGRWRRSLTSLVPRTGELRETPADGRTMVWVPTGSCRFGASEGDRLAVPAEFPPSELTVRGFWIDRDEVSNDDYRRCVAAGACSAPAESAAYADPNRGRYPVLGVSWLQAREYARWAGKRLPTEVEWECAARAGGRERFPWGDRWDPSLANALGAEGDDRWGAEAPVGSFPPNAWGVNDLIGNASEWVQDVSHSNLAGMPRDGRAWEQETGPIAERERVVRGGSYADPGSRQRVSRRSARHPEEPHRTVGFRCAAD